MRDEEFEQLVRTHFTRIARFAFGFVQSYDVAEDIAQTVLCRVWEKRASWNPKHGAQAYLFAAARHMALDLQKHAGVERRYQAANAGEALDAGSLDNPADETPDNKVARLKSVITTLTERQQTALRLRYEQKLQIQDIANILGVSTRAVERLLERALDALRDALTGVEGVDE